jgi:hypothetical protein
MKHKSKKRKSRKQLKGVLAQKKYSRSKKAREFSKLIAKNLDAGCTPMQAIAAAKNGVWVQKS